VEEYRKQVITNFLAIAGVQKKCNTRNLAAYSTEYVIFEALRNLTTIFTKI